MRDDRERRTLREDIESVERLRDELRVRAHLMKAELRDRWRGLERRWDEYRANPAHGPVVVASELVSEIKGAYEELRSDLAKLGRGRAA